MKIFSSHYRFSRHMGLILLFLALGIGLTGLLYYAQQKKTFKHNEHEQLAAIAALKVGEITRWRKERMDDSVVIMDNPLLKDGVAGWLENPERQDLGADILKWMNSMLTNYDYKNIMLLDKKMSARLSASAAGREVGEYARSLAAEAMRERKIIFSDLYRSEDGRDVNMDIFIPVSAGEGASARPAGVILSRIDPRKILFSLIQSWPVMSRTAESLIVRSEGNDLVYLSGLRYRTNTALDFRVPMKEGRQPAAMAARGEEGIVEGPDYRGVQVLAAVRKIPGSSWVLIAKEDAEEIYAPMRERFWIVMFAVVGLITFSAVGAGFIWRSRSAQFYRKQYESEMEHLSLMKQYERKQEQLIGELANANQDLNDFAYIVSHDLKAPLRSISALAQWLAADYSDNFDAQGKEYVSLIIKRAQRLDELISGILEYSRIEHVMEEKVEVNVGELVGIVLDMLSPPPGISIVVENELPTVVFQQTRLSQVFQNLLGNAIKFMDKPDGEIRIGCVSEDGDWRFSVSDNGPGIDEKYFEKIFQIFQTLKARDEIESTGIGLTLVKKIIEMYGGRIWVESRVGIGSVFYFTIRKDGSEVTRHGTLI